MLVLPGNLACVNGLPRGLTYAGLISQVPKSLPCASASWNFGLFWGLPISLPPGIKMKISTKGVNSGMNTIWLVYHFSQF